MNPRSKLAISVDPAFDPSTVQGVSELLTRVGLSVGSSEQTSMRLVSSLENLRGNGKLGILLNKGPLTSDHASCMRMSPAALILAVRDGTLPSEWETRCMMAVLTDAPLYNSTPPIRLTLRRTFAIQAAAHEAAQVVREAGGGSFASACAADVMHEISANALLVAPIHEDGTPKYALQRDAKLDIATEDGCEVCIWLSDNRIFLSATDHFGRLGTAPLASALAGLGKRARVDVSGGGAGLGLRRIVEQSDLVAIRVEPGRKCEVTCAVELAENRRRSMNPKSLMYFVSRGQG